MPLKLERRQGRSLRASSRNASSGEGGNDEREGPRKKLPDEFSVTDMEPKIRTRMPVREKKPDRLLSPKSVDALNWLVEFNQLMNVLAAQHLGVDKKIHTVGTEAELHMSFTQLEWYARYREAQEAAMGNHNEGDRSDSPGRSVYFGYLGVHADSEDADRYRSSEDPGGGPSRF